jgi:hypothetical protein
MLPPIFPKPIIPSCIVCPVFSFAKNSFSSFVDFAEAAQALLRTIDGSLAAGDSQSFHPVGQYPSEQVREPNEHSGKFRCRPNVSLDTFPRQGKTLQLFQSRHNHQTRMQVDTFMRLVFSRSSL